MLKDLTKTPFPWFGGKTSAAPAVWEALGDTPHYVEPFFGGGAVLLRRPHPCNRPYFSETVNDLDGFLCNFWRAIQKDPEAVAVAASWPVSECDLHARHLALLKWNTDQVTEELMGDPNFCAPKMAGWWVWGLCSWIGGGWCSGRGPWVVGADGRIMQRERVRTDRAPGVSRRRPQVCNGGQGVNHPGTREPGVSRKRPHVSDGGHGVNRPGTREPGVSDGGGGEDFGLDCEFHPMTMPELLRWFEFLQARLRHVRILCGDWKRSVTTGAAFSLTVRQGKGPAGVFLDPPYSHAVRDSEIYSEESSTAAADCRAWCLKNGDNSKFRIVLAGFAGEGHEDLESHGWRCVEWYKSGFLKGGMGNTGGGNKQHLERLWLSPHCLPVGEPVGEMEPETEPETENNNQLTFC